MKKALEETVIRAGEAMVAGPLKTADSSFRGDSKGDNVMYYGLQTNQVTRTDMQYGKANAVPLAPVDAGLHGQSSHLLGRMRSIEHALDALLSRLNGPTPSAITQGPTGQVERPPAIGELTRYLHESASVIEKQIAQLTEAIG